MNHAYTAATGCFVQLEGFGKRQFVVWIDDVLNPGLVEGFIVGRKGNLGRRVGHVADTDKNLHIYSKKLISLLKNKNTKLRQKPMSSAKDNPRITQLFSLIEQQGADAFSTYALAMEYRKAGESREAINWLHKTLELDPEYLAVFYQLAALYASLDDNKNALITYDQGIQLAEAKKDLKTLAELKNARMNLELEF